MNITFITFLFCVLVLPVMALQYPREMYTPKWSKGVPLIQKWPIECSSQYDDAIKNSSGGFVDGCHPRDNCARVVVENFVTSDEQDGLLSIIQKGLQYATPRSHSGGPTIMDINTGFIRDSFGHSNMYKLNPTLDQHAQTQPAQFSTTEYALYKNIIERIRRKIMEEFNLSTLHFTAPTFVTRTVGNSTWSPRSIHDEYWHPHIDKNNTEFYDYSGLLYLSDQDFDFTGGHFAWLDGDHDISAMMKDGGGRLIIFSAGQENLHQVQKVIEGSRIVLSIYVILFQFFFFFFFFS
eukprot:GSMAST32.ASY1.ANO1.2242.1 assembled CDS